MPLALPFGFVILAGYEPRESSAATSQTRKRPTLTKSGKVNYIA
jgi:hypothetical protein